MIRLVRLIATLYYLLLTNSRQTRLPDAGDLLANAY